MGPLQSPDQPGPWSTHVSLDDADAAAATVTATGGPCWSDRSTCSTRDGWRCVWTTAPPPSRSGSPSPTPGPSSTEFQRGSRSIAGMRPMGPEYPEGLPPHWLPYFAVRDTDKTVAKATELGGAVMAPAMDIEQGRFAVLADPFGATFAVIKMAAPGA